MEYHRVFEAFVCWIYTGRLKDPPKLSDNATAASQYLGFGLLSKIWVFADMRGVPALGNAAIDMLHERVSACWTTYTQAIHYIYEETMPGSHLRKFLVDSFALTKKLERLEKIDPDQAPGQFLFELFPAFIRRGENARPLSREAWTKLNRCQWHDHSGPGGQLRLDSRK